MRRPGHPSMRRLQRWLNGEDMSLERHLATCEYCTSRLEPLLEEDDGGLRPALLALLSTPEELPERLQAGIDQRMRNRSDLTLISELFGLPFRTARVMTTSQGED